MNVCEKLILIIVGLILFALGGLVGSALALETDYVDRNMAREYQNYQPRAYEPNNYGYTYPDYYETRRAEEQSQQHGAGGCTPDYSTGGCLDE